MVSSREKTRSTQSQTCVKCSGIIIKRNSDVNTENISPKKCQNKVDFPDVMFNFSIMLCVLFSISCMAREL